ncbi:hypothetical protein DEU29_102118 [Idiomarina aquatica]|uniref:Uncharacterized protein n=1 Tax=Idiomarina aquatica TaxID=1327752 RepID=A0A4R6PQF9_9GAMM|nr:hypothetical protein [Idiomarina aquatica]TDP40218.1 hypothetical protein DEU29_102118 [Idiomarina aquatica]
MHFDFNKLVIAFLPHKPYHLDILQGLLSLENLPYKLILIDSASYYIDPSVKDRLSFIQEHEISKHLNVVRLEELIAKGDLPAMLCVFNDWERSARVLVEAYNDAKLPSIAIAEGVQDYYDELSPTPRFPYQCAKHILLPCPYDKRFFHDSRQSVNVVGNPRISTLRPISTSTDQNTSEALINYNFSYGALAHCKTKWLNDAFQAIQSAGMKPVIAVHPSEDTPSRFMKYVSSMPLHETISRCACVVSRFSTVILESLALNVPVVYFPPREESVDKFKTIAEISSIANGPDQLEAILKNKIFLKFSQKDVTEYLKVHAGTHIDHKSKFTRLLDLILESSFVCDDKRNDLAKLLQLRLATQEHRNNYYMKSQLRLRANQTN